MTNDYLVYKQKQLDDINTVEIFGVPLESNDALGNPSNGRQKRFPIRVCECVTEPCNCEDLFDKVILWFLRVDIIDYAETDKKDGDGNPVYKFKLAKDSDIIIESLKTVKAVNFVSSQASSIGCDCIHDDQIERVPTNAWVGPLVAAGLYLLKAGSDKKRELKDAIDQLPEDQRDAARAIVDSTLGNNPWYWVL